MLILTKETVHKLYELAFLWHSDPSEAIAQLVEGAYQRVVGSSSFGGAGVEPEQKVGEALQREVGDEDEG